MITAALRASIARHALESYPNECCGLVVNEEYFPCRNTSADPRNAFEVAPEDYVAAETFGPITALVHSHPGGAATPSEHDLQVCEEAGIPLWVIVSLGAQADGSVAIEDWCEFSPSGYSAPLLGCPFSHGTNDCYGLVRRWYWQTHRIDLPDFNRTLNWWDDGHSDLYTVGFPQAGFTALPNGAEPEVGDVLLMRVRSRNNVPNHAAIYLGEGQILHHCYGQLSRRDLLARYAPYVTHTLRHKEANTWNKSEPYACTES